MFKSLSIYLFIFVLFIGVAGLGFMYSVESEGNEFLKERINQRNEEITQCKVELTLREKGNMDKQIYWVGEDAFVLFEGSMKKVRSIEELQELHTKGYK